MNGGNSTMSFDVELEYTPTEFDTSIIRFQNNIQSIFDRVAIMYGSTPIEDITRYNQIVRSMTEWTSTGSYDQGSISDGIGHASMGLGGYVLGGEATALLGATNPAFTTTGTYAISKPVNSRQAFIHGISLQTAPQSNSAPIDLDSNGWGTVPYTPVNLVEPTGLGARGLTKSGAIKVKRRYVVQLNLGLFLQGKLVPLKYMASQLAVSIRLAPAADCIIWKKGEQLNYASSTFTKVETTANAPTYTVTNVNFIPELLEFDSSYDASFLEGLQNGVPLLFNSFNTFQFGGVTNSSNVTLSISERNRSIKSVFTMQCRGTADPTTDYGATFYTTGIAGVNTTANDINDKSSTLQEYQYRIGGRYFPASPVQCSLTVGGDESNGGGEAYLELAKALNTVGDYRLSTPCNTLSWASPIGYYYNATGQKTIVLNEHDGSFTPTAYFQGGVQYLVQVESAGSNKSAPGSDTFPDPLPTYVYAGRNSHGMNSCCFAMAINLETSNGMEISGLNAEEQSDISITMRWNKPQDGNMQFLVFTYYDAMLVLFENNVVQLIK